MGEKMKKLIPIIIAVLVIALCSCIVKINRLENELATLSRNFNSEVNMIRNEIAAIYGNVDDQLREQASLLTSVEAEYGEIDVDASTIDVTLKLVPKLISDDISVQVSIGGRTAELTRTGNAYTGTIPVELFNTSEQILLQIISDDGIQNQYISEVRADSLWYMHIPSLYRCDIYGGHSFKDGKYTFNGTIDLNCSPVMETPNVRFEKFEIVTKLNGEEINREDISQDVLNYETYPHGVYFRDEFHMECDAVDGDVIEIRLEATDSLGFLHTQLLHIWQGQNGPYAEAMDGSEYLYAPNGEQLFP